MRMRKLKLLLDHFENAKIETLIRSIIMRMTFDADHFENAKIETRTRSNLKIILEKDQCEYAKTIL